MSASEEDPEMKFAEPWGKGPARVWGLICRLREEAVYLEAVALRACGPFGFAEALSALRPEWVDRVESRVVRRRVAVGVGFEDWKQEVGLANNTGAIVNHDLHRLPIVVNAAYDHRRFREKVDST